jgi:hypothetical protein
LAFTSATVANAQSLSRAANVAGLGSVDRVRSGHWGYRAWSYRDFGRRDGWGGGTVVAGQARGIIGGLTANSAYLNPYYGSGVYPDYSYAYRSHYDSYGGSPSYYRPYVR